MKKEKKFYLCKHCGNLVGMINDAGVTPVCCGEPMIEMVPNTSEGAGEKHVPVIEVSGNKVTVTVGDVEHPMLEEHSIQWIYLETEHGGQRKRLSPGEKPQAVFVLEDDKAIAAYEYCNLHGLWKAEV